MYCIKRTYLSAVAACMTEIIASKKYSQQKSTCNIRNYICMKYYFFKNGWCWSSFTLYHLILHCNICKYSISQKKYSKYSIQKRKQVFFIIPLIFIQMCKKACNGFLMCQRMQMIHVPRTTNFIFSLNICIYHVMHTELAKALLLHT